jgi:hypothetical protein
VCPRLRIGHARHVIKNRIGYNKKIVAKMYWKVLRFAVKPYSTKSIAASVLIKA